MSSPIRQLQDHPEVSVTHSVLKNTANHGYKGTIEVANKGKSMVTFKVMSNRKRSTAKVKVHPSHGIIEAGEQVVLHMLVNNVSVDYTTSGLSLLLLISCCTILDDSNCEIATIANFWKIIEEENRAFVQIIKLNSFEFNVDSYGVQTIGRKTRKRRHKIETEASSNSSEVDDDYGFGDSVSESSVSSHYQTDSEEENSDDSRNLLIRKQKLRDTLDGMKTLSMSLEKSRKKVKRWAFVMAILLVVIFLDYMQKNLVKLEINVLLTSGKND
ncbi:unnamed protein product [Orchesella dallaii]|uniref:MSP domain-containing protein n=1 Tax=Orchesella dallaii TaxID=48710 RepID=A0ABP1S5N0_9HEXA